MDHPILNVVIYYKSLNIIFECVGVKCGIYFDYIEMKEEV